MSGWLRDCGAAGLWLLGGAAVVLGVLLYATRIRRVRQDAVADRILPAAMLAALVLICAGAEAGRFDGLPHVNAKFDATFFVWLQAVMLRAVAGIVTLALALPLGVTASRWAGTRQRLAPGLLVLVPPGLGLLASSIRLQLAARGLLTGALALDARLAVLREAMRDSERLLAAGTLVGIAGALSLAIMLLRRPA